MAVGAGSIGLQTEVLTHSFLGMVPADQNLTAEVTVPLPTGTRVHDHVIDEWLRAVPDGHIYRVVHAQTGAVASLHEYLPAAWAFRDAEGVMAKPGRGREFQVGLRRFLLRARQLRELEHPSLPRLIEAWPSHGTACILTAPAATKTLSDVVLVAGGRLALEQAWPWLCACCDLAEWLHQQGKIHGAWDPETIGVTEAGALILPMPEVDGPAHPASPWMPLEQTALAPKGVQRGPWTDVFGISGLAAFMLTGQSPATARRQPTTPLINTTARAPRAAAPETLPRAMMAAIRVSLLPNARQRPQDIAQLKAMMGLFATAPVLSDELKAALAAPVAPPKLPRSGLHMPAEPAADAPVRSSDAEPANRRERGSTGSTILARARDSGFGGLITTPMPLSPLAEPASRADFSKGAAADAKAEAFPAYRELPAWDGDEPLPPDPAVRRRKWSAGAAAAGTAMVAIAALWVFVDSPPKPQDPAAVAAALQARDMDRLLKATPPAAGGRPNPTSEAVSPTPAPPTVAAVPEPASTTDAGTLKDPQTAGSPGLATASVPSPKQAQPQPRALPSTQAQAPSAAAAEPAARGAQQPAVVPRPASRPPVALAQAQQGEGRAAPPARGPSCSQILLEQSLGARVSAADVRNCR